MYLLKSRGMSHSKQISEYELSDDGIHLTETTLVRKGSLTAPPEGIRSWARIFGALAATPKA